MCRRRGLQLEPLKRVAGAPGRDCGNVPLSSVGDEWIVHDVLRGGALVLVAAPKPFEYATQLDRDHLVGGWPTAAF